jgi:TRAP-type C4-dicarboxylate transport system permease small subunit
MERVFVRIDRAVELLVAVIFAIMCVIGLLQVFNRFVLNASLSWSEEAQIFGHIWIVRCMSRRFGRSSPIASVRCSTC